jgi:hypothetical protein
MSTTKKISLWKGIPATFKARETGKYDTIFTKKFNKSQTTNLSQYLDDYDGFKYSFDSDYDVPVLNVSNTILPWKWDYSTSLSNTQYTLVDFTKTNNVKKYVDSFSTVGSITEGDVKIDGYTMVGNVSINNGIASGFSNDDYLKINTPMPSTDYTDIIVKVTVADEITQVNPVIVHPSKSHDIYITTDRIFGIWDPYASKGYSGSTTVELGSTYWLHMTMDNSTNGFVLYILKDNEGKYTLDSTQSDLEVLPDLSEWSCEISAILGGNAWSNYAWYIGKHSQNSTYWQGSIDLNNFRIYCKGDLYADISESITYKNMATGFSKNNYIETGYRIPKVMKEMVIYTTIIPTTDWSGNQEILNIGGTSWSLIMTDDKHLGIYSSGYWYYNSSSTALTINTSYDIKLVIGSDFKVSIYYRKTGEDWINTFTYTFTGDYILNKLVYIGLPIQSYYYFRGYIDLNNTYITFDDDIVCKRNMKVCNESSNFNGCIDSDYEDDGSEHTFNCFVGPYTPASIDGTIGTDNTLDYRIILSDKEKFIWSDSINTSQQCRYLGTVLVPEHTVSSGDDVQLITTVEEYINYVNENSVLPVGNIVTIETLDDYAMDSTFKENTTITGQFAFNRLKSIGYRSMRWTIMSCTGVYGTASFPELETIGDHGMEATFEMSNVETVEFPKLKTVGDSAFYYAFNACNSLTSISFPALTNVQTYSFSNAFNKCYNLKEIHFRADMEDTIKALDTYSTNFAWSGSSNSDLKIYFDL